MKFGVVVFPGSNCDRDMIEALSINLGVETIQLWHKDEDLSNFSNDDCIVLPGGFSYGDYLRCGAIAQFSPMMKSVIKFANEGGKVLGVCNGFQILCEAGLLPGALLKNDGQKFVCKNTFIINEEDKEILSIPIAHGEGRYYADGATLRSLDKNSQIIYKYCDAAGAIDVAYNPNGSTNSIAGICNKERNVFGMMPHPERAVSEVLGNADGLKVFEKLFKLAKV